MSSYTVLEIIVLEIIVLEIFQRCSKIVHHIDERILFTAKAPFRGSSVLFGSDTGLA